MRQKMHKIEIGTHRPTEFRVGNKAVSEQVGVWLRKVHEAGKMRVGDGVQSNTQRIADVLVDLLRQIKDGKIDREVISQLVQKTSCYVPLKWAAAELERSG